MQELKCRGSVGALENFPINATQGGPREQANHENGSNGGGGDSMKK